MTTSAYETVPYDDHPVAETHPDRIHVVARRRGLELARPEAMRVLELGCAHAVNLVPMAFHLPGASFVGVDLSPGQIALARERIDELGLRNLEVRCADVMDLDLGDETFDLVIAHGLFSWVPEPVRDRVLEVCRRALVPTGVAYVSYNAMPAWGVRDGIRRALLTLAGDAGDEQEKLRRARAGLAALGELEPLRGTPEGALLAEEIAGLRDKGDAYLLHEYLAPHARAYWVSEVLALAHAAGLRYLDDVAPSGVAPAVERDTRERLRALSPDALDLEQLADVALFRQFRATLLRRDDAPLGAPLDDEGALALRLAARPSEDDGEDAALAALVARWPADASFGELAGELGVSSSAHGELRRTLVQHVERGRLQLRPRPLATAGAARSERPRVSALSRFEARHLSFLTTPLHEYAPLDAFHAALVRHLEGTRTRAQVVQALVEDIRAGRLKVAGGATPSASQLRAGLPPLVDAALGRLGAAGLLVA